MDIFLYLVTTLTFLGHVTSSVTWPFDSPGGISYKCSIVTESLSPTISEIMGICVAKENLNTLNYAAANLFTEP